MEPFFIDDKFYSDVESYLIDAELEREDIEKLPDDYKLKISGCDLEPMFQLDASELASVLVDNNTDRCSEDGDEFETIKKALSDSVDFEKLNKLIPNLWYPNSKEAELSKKELLDACD